MSLFHVALGCQDDKERTKELILLTLDCWFQSGRSICGPYRQRETTDPAPVRIKFGRDIDVSSELLTGKRWESGPYERLHQIDGIPDGCSVGD